MRGTVARIAGVQGVHRARPDAASPGRRLRLPRRSLVDALRAGEPFTVWDGREHQPGRDADPRRRRRRLIARARRRRPRRRSSTAAAPSHVDRVELARRAVAAFGLDTDLLDTGPPPDAAGRRRALRHAPATRRHRAGARRRAPALTTMLERLARAAESRSYAHEQLDGRPGTRPVPRRAGGRARRRALAVLRRLLRHLRARQRRRASVRRCTSRAGAARSTRRATSRRWCTSRPATRASATASATFACTTSVGPGATNMVTGAAGATINRLPGAAAARRRVRDALPAAGAAAAGAPARRDVSVNDCLRPVSRFFDRIERPEQLVPAALEAMRVLTDPAETGAVTLALPEDVQTEALDSPTRSSSGGCGRSSAAAGPRGSRAGRRADPRRATGR